jgi:dihydroorotate dehydrogenase
MTFYDVVKSLLFRFDAEDVHGATLRALAFASSFRAGRSLLKRSFDLNDDRLKVEAFGLTFRNPVGLAGGYDKDGVAVVGLGCLGFGHVEVGTVTQRPQPGNPRPRIYRLPEDNALINTMGFPSQGSEAVARRLAALPRSRDLIVGVNLGKNKDTPLEEASEEYRAGVRTLYNRADYLSINISSPNTMGLRQLQSREYLGRLVATVTAECAVQRKATARRVPLLVKLAPDMTWAELDEALDTLLAGGVDGIIATNATTDRQGLRSPLRDLPGGLSGVPFTKRNTEIVAYVRKQVGARLPIVAVGGIFTGDDVRAKLDAGATLVQVYTGLIYRGPGMVRDILRGLLAAR